MNINLEIANRALNKAGEESLTEKELEEKGNRWQLIKDFYHATILETLANTAWTSQTVRGPLAYEDEDDSGLYIYTLPEDCAKPIGLVSQCDYTVETKRLITDDPNPILIYVSNNYTGEYKYLTEENVKPEDIRNYEYTASDISADEFEAGSYYIKNGTDFLPATVFDPEEIYYTRQEHLINRQIYIQHLPESDWSKILYVKINGNYILSEEYDENAVYYRKENYGTDERPIYRYVEYGTEMVLAQTYESDRKYFKRLEEDYPLYDDYNFDPLLAEYIETKLASKMVLKITGNTSLYQLLYNEAMLMENRAIKATVAHAHNKDKGNRYWGEILGLPDYGDR